MSAEISCFTVVIFSDSSSALDALKTPPYEHPEVEKAALAIHNILTSYDIKVTLQWIPGHNDLSGNEKADKLAKKGTQKPQKDNPCTMATVKTILKSQSKETWQNKWATGTTGRAYFAEKSKPKKKKMIASINLTGQTKALFFNFELVTQQ